MTITSGSHFPSSEDDSIKNDDSSDDERLTPSPAEMRDDDSEPQFDEASRLRSDHSTSPITRLINETLTLAALTQEQHTQSPGSSPPTNTSVPAQAESLGQTPGRPYEDYPLEPLEETPSGLQDPTCPQPPQVTNQQFEQWLQPLRDLPDPQVPGPIAAQAWDSMPADIQHTDSSQQYLPQAPLFQIPEDVTQILDSLDEHLGPFIEQTLGETGLPEVSNQETEQVMDSVEVAIKSEGLEGVEIKKEESEDVEIKREESEEVRIKREESEEIEIKREESEEAGREKEEDASENALKRKRDSKSPDLTRPSQMRRRTY
ncbi:hypothetical protein FHETE_7902 [Fusarium heterosporum]|uniref:Uncharacterized protein n=1 Tax=Fusarium heterosporum TaxID=42747 RepID=A0A8H5T4P9_FUSHE|nr:hypothetical protein FHETE_7902 [Fusarium heterosporum]